jgi:hypothetical protein
MQTELISMGKLFDDFNDLKFHNEAEVSQNFILPILQKYLGYDFNEVIPEHQYPAKDIYSGVSFRKGASKSLNHRPDYIVCINGDLKNPKFIIDSKSPKEGVDDHLGQLRSYALSTGQNLLMMTNGKDLKVYDVNNLLFHSVNIEDLQIKIDSLIGLLGRTNQLLKSPIDIIKDFDYRYATSVAGFSTLDEEVKRKKIILADFMPYLKKLVNDFSDWHTPTRYFKALSNLELFKINPNFLLTFRHHSTESTYQSREKTIRLSEIEADRTMNIKIFSGETGVGKSCLLKFLTNQLANNCLELRETRIPIYVSLREIGYNSKLEDIVVNFLNRNGFHCTSIYELPKTNDFIFFLDAFDEVNEQFHPETFNAIEYLSSDYECYLTTRPNIVPQFRPSLVFDVLPIEEQQVMAVVRQHIPLRYYEFNRQIEASNLKTESGNILLLLCLISLFKDSGILPTTVTQIVREITVRVKKWQESKNKKGSEFTWDLVEQFLAVVAFELVSKDETSLTKKDTISLLYQKQIDLENNKQLAPKFSTAQILDFLSETGLIIVCDDHTYFWHRIFLNYFVALALKEKVSGDYTLISKLAKDTRWEIGIIGLSAFLPSITGLIKALKENLWLSSYCLVENNRCDAQEINRIIVELVTHVKSIVPQVRIRAATYLSHIESNIAKQFFFEAINGDYADDVKIIAISTIGKTRSQESLEIIYSFINWDKSNIFTDTSSQAHIARALCYYGEDEHLQIIDNWKNARDYIMDVECRNIFFELYNTNRLTPKLIIKLKNLYIEEYQSKQPGRDKLDILAQVLTLVPDDAFALQVIEMAWSDSKLFKIDSAYTLLKSYSTREVIEVIKSKIYEETDEPYAAEKFVEIMTDSAYPVPKEIYLELTEHPNSNIASKAIGALKRFPYGEIEEELRKFLYGNKPQQQSWALGVLIDNGEIVKLIRRGAFPETFYYPAAHTLLKAIRRFNLAEAKPLMDRVFHFTNRQWRNEYYLAFDLAGTYYFLGEKDKHKEILGWYYDGERFTMPNDNMHFHIMKMLKYFDPIISGKIAECYFNTYFPFIDDDVRFKAGVFLEAAEDLGQHSLVEFIKKIVDALIDEINKDNSNKNISYHFERPMRALTNLVLPADEDWILERLDSMHSNIGFDFPELRRAAECLGFAGSKKSIPYLKKIATQFKDREMILNVCQFAYERICLREKIPNHIGDIFNYTI